MGSLESSLDRALWASPQFTGAAVGTNENNGSTTIGPGPSLHRLLVCPLLPYLFQVCTAAKVLLGEVTDEGLSFRWSSEHAFSRAQVLTTLCGRWRLDINL